MSLMQTLKPALQNRVRLDQAETHAFYRNSGFEGFCPAGGGDIFRDVYGRPVNPDTLLLNDAACSTQYPIRNAQGRLRVEAVERPYITLPHLEPSDRCCTDRNPKRHKCRRKYRNNRFFEGNTANPNYFYDAYVDR
jgi:hypothetical protein